MHEADVDAGVHVERFAFRDLSSDAFLNLARRCHLPLEREDLDELVERGWLAPLERGEGEAVFRPLHLFALALYFDEVMRPRHPWRSVESPDFELVDRIARRIAEAERGVYIDELDEEQRHTLTELALELERYLRTIDPFGPLTEVVDMLRPAAVERLEGRGRLCAELRVVATALADRAEREGGTAAPPQPERPRRSATSPGRRDGPSTGSDDLRNTREHRPVAPAESSSPSEAEEPAPPSRDEPAEQGGAASESERPAANEATERKNRAAAPPGEAGSSSSMASTQPTGPPPEMPEPDAEPTRRVDGDGAPEPPPSKETPPESGVADETAPTLDSLDHSSEARMKTALIDTAKFQERDRSKAEERSDVSEVSEPAEQSPDDAPDEAPEGDRPKIDLSKVAGGEGNPFMRRDSKMTSRTLALSDRLEKLRSGEGEELEDLEREELDEDELAEQIQELNRLRQQYLREQRWEKLVELYQERIHLFEDPAERQQVLVTLGTLFEAKLEDTRKAFYYFEMALREPSRNEASNAKALEGLRRLGKRDELRELYIEWMEARLEEGVEEARRRVLQRDLALALAESGEERRAYYSYAAFLVDAPERYVTAAALDALETLADTFEEGAAELEEFYAELLEQEELDGITRGLVARRAGMRAVERGMHELAIDYLERAQRQRPDDEAVFHMLAQMYEEQKRWSSLVEHYDRRIERTGESSSVLLQGLEEALDRELEEPEAVERYERRLEDDPDDLEALERYVRAKRREAAYSEVYGLLNRLVERAERDDVLGEMRRYLAEIAREHLYAPEEALYHYEHALDAVESPGIELRMGMVDVLVDLQRWEDALEKVESLLSDRDAALTDEHRVAILSQGAKAAAEAGLSEKSQTLYKKILVLRPDHPEARNAIAGAD